MAEEIYCYKPSLDEVDGSWVGLETFLHLGAAEGEYVCLLSDMRKVSLRWSGECFLERVDGSQGAWCQSPVGSLVRSVLCR